MFIRTVQGDGCKGKTVTLPKLALGAPGCAKPAT